MFLVVADFAEDWGQFHGALQWLHDLIEFEVALNPGQDFGPLSRVASGGELSRISLALEVVAAGATAVPTMVCLETGKVIEFVEERIEALQAEIAERHGYTIEDHSLVLYVRPKSS